MKWCLTFCILCSLQFSVRGQEDIPFNNDYPFIDGVYLSFEEFKGNNPTHLRGQFRIIPMDSMRYDLSDVKKIKVLNKRDRWKTVPIARIWGLCLDGVPYIFYRGPGDINKVFSKFEHLTRVDVIGTISMFRIEQAPKSFQTNSLSPREFHNKNVVVLDMLLDIHSGRVHPFNYKTVEHYIRNDQELLEELKEYRQYINLYDIVFAYNNRNVVYPSPVSFTERADKKKRKKKQKEQAEGELD